MEFTKKNRASIAFELEWESTRADHRERVLIPKADLWKDVVPHEIERVVTGAVAGDRFEFPFPAGTAVPENSDGNLLAVRTGDVRRPPPLCGVPLRAGRFYPRGILSPSGQFFSEDVRPFRVTGIDGEWIIIDTNHPLSPYPLVLRAQIVKVLPRGNMLGGSCSAWTEILTDGGPGMEGRWKDRATDFAEDGAWTRESEDDDRFFYVSPRLVGHVDSLASSFLREEYGRRIPAGGKVLDLMSSLESHLPEDRGLRVTGLGMNEPEMEANPLLEKHLVHDLNISPALPFRDGAFDAVVCSLSYEYLTRPAAMIAEVSRLLGPGGIFLVGLSNRWFPPKVTRLWTALHEFERVGLVLEHLCEDGSFGDFRTLSVRGWPRPFEDRHYGPMRISDPVYMITAVKRG